MSLTKTITVYAEEGEAAGYDEQEHELPARYVVCSRCEGHGTHLTPSIGQHAYTAEEFAEAFHDDDDRAAYFSRGGIYDVCCEECQGQRVTLEIDAEACTGDLAVVLALYKRQQEARARIEAEDRRTRYYESGGYDY